MNKPRRGEVFETVIETIDEKGQGVGYRGDYTVCVRGGLPGDRMRVVARKIRHGVRRIDARKDELVESGRERITPNCTHFGLCGGCLWQDVAYEEQVSLKQQLVEQCLNTVGIDVVLDKPLTAPSPFYYRNKMEFSFGTSKEGEAQLGLHIPGRFDRVFDVEACYLQSKISNAIVDYVRRFVVARGLSVYHLKRHEGLLRFLTIREGKNTDEVMVVLTTSGEECNDLEELANGLCETFSQVKCVIHAINRRKAQVAFGDEEIVLAGENIIRECLGDFVFEISPQSFFQTNTHQAEGLYQRVVELAALSEADQVLDVYCGAGSISMFLAQKAKSVLGIEISEDAVSNAVRNTAQNGVENCQFMAGQAEQLLKQLVLEGNEYDVAITDPPRSGMHPKAREALIELRPRRMVYVSCNPAALAQDLSVMVEAGYGVEYVQLVDMFPHTPHCEVLTLLNDKN